MGDKDVSNSNMPAFPRDSFSARAVAAVTPITNPYGKNGMTKRELMAMTIAAGVAASNVKSTRGIVARAVDIADALLKELDKKVDTSREFE